MRLCFEPVWPDTKAQKSTASALKDDAACLLVTDIDRGGAVAHLYGAWAMLSAAEQKLIKGFVLNRFRGDATLLAPGPQMLQDLTGVPTVATLLMWWQHDLPEVDELHFLPLPLGDGRGEGSPISLTIAVIAYPHISNLDEFLSLKNIPGVRQVRARSPAELAGFTSDDWIILPGSKATSSET